MLCISEVKSPCIKLSHSCGVKLFILVALSNSFPFLTAGPCNLFPLESVIEDCINLADTYEVA
nr:MAG TPA: hypothetical protein [Bacteriophage sp.]